MIRVALAQIDTSVGAFSENVSRILSFIQKAADEGVELVVFPELSLSSYPPLDLLDRDDFADSNAQALSFLLKGLHQMKRPPYVVLGAITLNPHTVGRKLYNSVLVLGEGRLLHEQAKQLLPTYDVFDESRYFEPGQCAKLWESPWGIVGFSICEDAWFADTLAGRKLYNKDPALQLQGARFSINVSASPFEQKKQRRREEMMAGFAMRTGVPLIYVNQVGANDEILFDGTSRVVDARGETQLLLPSFVEGLAVFQFEAATGKVRDPSFWHPHEPVLKSLKTWRQAPDSIFTSHLKTNNIDMASLHQGLVAGIQDYFQKTGFKQAVVGLSGGIDSAVVAVLAAHALGPENVLGVAMPSQYSSSHSLTDAEELACNLGIEFRVAPIKMTYTTMMMELKHHFKGAPADVTEENIQARIRGVMLMALANKRQGLLLTTGNKSELAVGYCTIYGDMCGALAPLGDVYKTRVYELARYLNQSKPVIPSSTLTKPPSAELRPHQRDQDSLPPYETLDELLDAHIEGGLGLEELMKQGFDSALVKKILGLVRNSEFKRRQAAPVLKVTSKAFGLGRRYPIAKGF